MIQLDDDKRWVRQFSSLMELEAWLRVTPRQWGQHTSLNERPTRDWDLGVGYGGALKLASEGWEEGVRNLHALSALVPNQTIATREYSMAGDYPDVPRYISGDPFNMIKRGKQRAPKPSMTIAVNTRISCAITRQQSANFGAAMVALVDRLESRGVRVELLGLLATNVTRRRMCLSWTIKRAEDHLDLSAVAFSYAHPAMFRRLGFAAMERMPKATEDYGYGIDGGVSRSDFVDVPEGALLINGVNHEPARCKTMPDALAFAKAQINAAAGEDVVELEDWDSE
jgi:hypothetical protein